MALKDWQETERSKRATADGEHYREWKHTIKDKDGMHDVVTVERPPNKWLVVISTVNGEKVHRCKSELGALNVAKAYMRKN